MSESYTFQANPSAPIESFSDKPLRVAGVKYQPRWAWSDSYRKEFRAAITHRGWRDKGQNGMRDRASKYLGWWDHQHREAGIIPVALHDYAEAISAFQEGRADHCPCGTAGCPFDRTASVAQAAE